jgi:hypothetical protein
MIRNQIRNKTEDLPSFVGHRYSDDLFRDTKESQKKGTGEGEVASVLRKSEKKNIQQ